jgi:hypothetical protein
MIIEKPAGVCFSGMLPKLKINATATVDIEMSVAGELIFAESYVPDDAGNITVELKSVVEQNLSLQFPTSDVFEQTRLQRTFHLKLTEGQNQSEEFEFIAIRGGLKTLSITPELWLQSNFLTWQAQEKRVEYTQPEWLTVFDTETVDIHVRAYYAEITPKDRTLANVEHDKAWTVNVSFGLLAAQFNDIMQQPLYFDVWTERFGSRRSYVQRYILKQKTENSETYIFENSLGGLDTVTFDGRKTSKPEFEEKTARYENIEIGYDVVQKDITAHQTGYITRYEALWLRDLFGSMRKYHAVNGTVEIIITESVAYKTDSDNDLIGFEWSYRTAKEPQYMAIERNFNQPSELLEVITPDSKKYYIVPRLLDFQEAAINDNMLFPVQSPFEQKWYRLSYGTLINRIQTDLNIAASEPDWNEL